MTLFFIKIFLAKYCLKTTKMCCWIVPKNSKIPWIYLVVFFFVICNRISWFIFISLQCENSPFKEHCIMMIIDGICACFKLEKLVRSIYFGPTTDSNYLGRGLTSNSVLLKLVWTILLEWLLLKARPSCWIE